MSEQDYLISKASRDDWKNISHWEDKRSQGRSTARNGKNLAGAGGTAVGIGYGMSQYSPQTFGRFDDAAGKAHGWYKSRALFPREHNLRQLGYLIRSNSGPAVAAAGVGAMGVGGAMWAAGRAKARHAESKIAQRRKERGKKG